MQVVNSIFQKRSEAASEAATGGVLWKKVFLKFNISQKITVLKSLFNLFFSERFRNVKVYFIKKRLYRRRFPVNIAKFLG